MAKVLLFSVYGDKDSPLHVEIELTRRDGGPNDRYRVPTMPIFEALMDIPLAAVKGTRINTEEAC